MLDVIFVACIFMIITISYAHDKSVEVNTPDYESYIWCCDGCLSLVVTVDQASMIWIENRLVQKGELLDLLKAVRHNAAEGLGVAVRAETRSRVAAYTYVVDQAQLAGISNVWLVPYEAMP